MLGFALSINQVPLVLLEVNSALYARQLIIIELNRAAGHAADRDHLITFEGGNLFINFFAINEIQLDTVINSLVAVGASIKLDCHVRVSKRNDVPIFEGKWLLDFHKSTASIT